MQPQENLNMSGETGDSGALICSQCGSPMPQGMRFCRACGNRLGEGPAEYTETVRLRDAPTAGHQATPFTPTYAPIAQQTPYKKKKKLSGMVWIIIIIGSLFLLGGVLSAVRRSVNPRTSFSGAVS